MDYLALDSRLLLDFSYYQDTIIEVLQFMDWVRNFKESKYPIKVLHRRAGFQLQNQDSSLKKSALPSIEDRCIFSHEADIYHQKPLYIKKVCLSPNTLLTCYLCPQRLKKWDIIDIPRTQLRTYILRNVRCTVGYNCRKVAWHGGDKNNWLNGKTMKLWKV